jgi:hypothetical protein
MQTGTSAPAATTTRRALLIGVDGYVSVNGLRGCVNDILAVRDFLVNKAGFPAANVKLLLAPAPGATLPANLGTVDKPTKANIQRAFQDLAQNSQPDDQVVVYYSGHGTRFANPQNPREQIGSIVPMDAQLNGTNFYINRELNKSIQSVVGTGAVATVVFDACHSGGIARGDLGDDPNGPTVREIVIPPEYEAEAWATVQAEHGLTAADLAGDGGSRDLDGSGWVPSISEAVDLVILSGCRDIETSKEYVPPGSPLHQGALTYFLLDSLRGVTAERIAGLRWGDIYPGVRSNVSAAFSDQHPTLEGRSERPVFGGTWQPYDPGFTVTPAGSGTVTLDGGTIQGLDVGARVMIYPPGTADFRAAQQGHKQLGEAEITSATAVTSQARVVSSGTAIPAGARAQLTKPSTRQRPLSVKLTGVPADVAAAIQADADAKKFLSVNPSGGTADVEVRAWQHDGKDAWAIVPLSRTEQPINPNDVIGHASLAEAGDAGRLGAALAGGLVQWAKYWAVLTRRNEDTTLQGAISAVLLAGRDDVAMTANPSDPQAAHPVTPNAAGQYVIGESDSLLLKLKVTGGRNLFLGVLLCSDEGNIYPLWPPANAENIATPGEEKIVGLNGPNAFALPVGTDPPQQTASLYTFKIFASDEQHPIDIQSLALKDTVQEVITNIISGKGVPEIRTPRTDVLWTTLDLPVLVQKGQA